jgi:hypothetical protein
MTALRLAVQRIVVEINWLILDFNPLPSWQQHPSDNLAKESYRMSPTLNHS